jgi:hypothetical protein
VARLVFGNACRDIRSELALRALELHAVLNQ